MLAEWARASWKRSGLGRSRGSSFFLRSWLVSSRSLASSAVIWKGAGSPARLRATAANRGDRMARAIAKGFMAGLAGGASGAGGRPGPDRGWRLLPFLRGAHNAILQSHPSLTLPARKTRPAPPGYALTAWGHF